MSEETQPESTVLPDWTKGKSVSSFALASEEVDVLNFQMDSEIPILEFSWFAVKANASTSNVEEQEKLEAIKQQIALGIINTDGSPVSTRKKNAEESSIRQPGGKLARKALRMREKTIVKDMTKQQKLMNKKIIINNQEKIITKTGTSDLLNRINDISQKENK